MSDLNVSLIISAIDHLTGPIKRMSKNVKKALTGITAPVKKLTQAFSSVGSEAKKLATKFAVLGGAAAYGFKRLFVDTAAEFERYQVMLRSLEGSNEKAAESMRWVENFATRAPLQLSELMQGFVKLRTFGIDPTNGTLQALVDQNAKMGGSGADLQGIILAVGQAWSKQKLQGEEALQLIERGVPVWDLLAKATGRNAVELQELSAKGKLGRKAIKLLIDEIGKNAKGAAQEQAKTWSGMVSMLSDWWTRFANMVMENGVFDWLKGKLSGFLQMLNEMTASGKLQELATQFGQRLVAALEGLWSAAQEVWTVMKQIGSALSWLHDLFGSWQPIIYAVAAVMAGPLLLSLAGATKAVIGLGVALLTTPVGWIIMGIAAIAGAVALIYKNWEPIKAFFAGVWGWIKDTFKQGIEWLTTILEYSPIGLLLKGVDKLRGLMGSTQTGTGAPSGGTTLSGAARPSRAEVNGQINIKVDSEGRARVAQIKSDSSGVDLGVETGMAAMGAW